MMENFQQVHVRKAKSADSLAYSVAFDDSSDLVWFGDQKGRVTSYSGPTLNAYTSFIGANNSAVYQILNHPRGILTLGKETVKLTNRHGFPKFVVNATTKSLDLKSPKDFRNFRAMCYGPTGQNSIILGGESNSKLIDFDLNKLKVNGTISHGYKVSIMKSSNKFLVVGNANGSLDILDTSSNNSIVKSFQAHQLAFSTVDIQNFTLATTGYSKRHNYGSVSVVDPLINVYDLRYLKPLAPVSFPAGASFVCLHPKLPNMCFACSATGQLQFIDLFNINNFKIYQVNLLNPNSPTYLGPTATNGGPRIVKMELSNSGDYLILTDNFNTLYLWSADPASHFNNFTKPLEYPVDTSYTEMQLLDVDDLDKPLNVVGMPYYKEELLSNWPIDLKFKVGTLPKRVPNELLRNSQSTKRGNLAPGFQRERTTEVDLRYVDYNKNKYGPRNRHQQWFSLDSKDKKDNVPRFISEKEKDEDSSSGTDSDSEDDPDISIGSVNGKESKLDQIFEYKPSPAAPLKIPPAFSKLHILYSRFGIEDFDFKFYNRSKKKFSGLEIDIENSYCNSLLILYRFVPEFYNWVTQSLAKDPFIYDPTLQADMLGGKSLLFELGYLFDMISNSKGKNCRTTNFQNVLCSITEARQLGLIDEGRKPFNGTSDQLSDKSINQTTFPYEEEDEADKLTNLIHSFNRFLLQRLSFDERRLVYSEQLKHGLANLEFNSLNSQSLDRICGINLETEVKSTSCTNFSRRTSMYYSLDVNCMTNSPSTNAAPSLYDSPKIHPRSFLYPNNNFKPKAIGKFNSYSDNSSAYLYNQSILPYIDAAMNNHSPNPVKIWCTECHRYQAMDTIKTVRNLPHILSLNLNLDDDREIIRKVSANQVKDINNKKSKQHHWLVDEFYAKLSNSSQRPILKLNYSDFNTKSRGQSIEKNSPEPVKDELTLSTNTSVSGRKKSNNEIVRYELVGYVCEISGSEENGSAENKHLVTFVKVYNQYNPVNDTKLGNTKCSYQWYLFNDFLITPISEIEVFNLSYWWKKPLIVLYQSNKSPRTFQNKIEVEKLDTEILYRDYFARGTREGKRIEYTLLTKEEAPRAGTVVALDAEFVIIESDKYEIRSNGTKVLVKPKRQSLARVSVVRGDEGPMKGVPFIDDYIMVEEPVEDYITSFSGIEKGDLDPNVSTKSLTYLEVAYRKLWLLLQIGVIFVGHGLANDFRAINIQVPPDQVRDTLMLYYKKEVKRKLGLKFLMYAVMNEDVQTGNHDSIEDARSALKLYDRFKELGKENRFKTELDRIYREGSRYGFKVPSY